MVHRILITLGLLGSVLLLPAVASAAVAFTKQNDYSPAGYGIYVAHDDGTGAHSLGVRGTGPAISPDGLKVAYFAGSNFNATALRIRTLATGAQVVAQGLTSFNSVAALAWSPDASQLLVGTESVKANGYVTGDGLAVVDTTTGVATTIVAAKGNEVQAFSWSPAGAQFAYDFAHYGSSFGDSIVKVANADGTGVASLGKGSSPVWGPRLIAFERNYSVPWGTIRAYHSQVWTVDPAVGSSSTKQLTRYIARHPLVLGPYAATWSPDGTTLIGSVGGEDYVEPVRITVGNGKIRYITGAGGKRLLGSYPLAVSADGATLLVSTNVDGGNERTVTMPLLGGASTPFLKGALSITVTSNWQP